MRMTLEKKIMLGFAVAVIVFMAGIYRGNIIVSAVMQTVSGSGYAVSSGTGSSETCVSSGSAVYSGVTGTVSSEPESAVSAVSQASSPAASGISETVKLSASSLTVTKGKTASLKVTVGSENTSDVKLTWKSSNTNVATVDGNGKITAKSTGKCAITVSSQNGASAVCSLTVKEPVSVSSVKLSKSSIAVTKGYTYTLKATVSPSNATDKTLTWETSDSSIATVSGSGKITAKRIGKCTVSVSTSNNKIALCVVTVEAPVAVSSVTLSSSELTLTKGKTSTLKAYVNPTNATNQTLTWKSSNSKVAKVSSSGKVTAVDTGSCKITVTSSNGKSSSCSVTVKSATASVSSAKKSILSVDTQLSNIYVTGSLSFTGYALCDGGVKSVNVYIDGSLIGTADTGITRSDAYSKYPSYNDKKSGFSFSLSDMSKIGSGTHTLMIKSVGNDGNGTSKSYTIHKKSPVLVIETPPNKDGYYGDSLTVSGYSLNASGVDCVKIYLDSVSDSGYKGTAAIGVKRSDIASQYPSGYSGSSESGFTYTMDISGLNFASTHTIYAVAYGNDGETIQKNATFLAGNVIYTSYSTSLGSAISKQTTRTPALQVSGVWEFAKIISGVKGYYKGTISSSNWFASDSAYNNIISKLSYYIDPSNFINNSTQKYQFLKLSYVDCVTASQLNAVFDGVLSGHGSDFIAAAKEYNVNPVYLAGHAIEETANGTSALSTGVYVAAGSYPAGTVETSGTYYNLFGINATDSSPLTTGSQYAAVKGWNSIKDAIYGGAHWIAGNYIDGSYSQDTVYKMRWNPQSPGTHQYATDVRWAYNQMNDIKTCFDYFSGVKLVFDIPRYAS